MRLAAVIALLVGAFVVLFFLVGDRLITLHDTAPAREAALALNLGLGTCRKGSLRLGLILQ